MLFRVVAGLATIASVVSHSHEGYGPLNPVLGTHGYPDCVPGPLGVSDDLEANQMNMVCAQKKAPAAAIRIGCVGDSITAGTLLAQRGVVISHNTVVPSRATKYL